MKKGILSICGLVIVFFLSAQHTPTCFRVTLADKNNSPYSVDNPQAYLSERALAKRARFQIPITEQDFPVNPQYIEQIKALDADISVLCSCRWLNTVTIFCPNVGAQSALSQLSFVTEVLPVANYDLTTAIHVHPAVPNIEEEPIVAAQFLDEPVVPYDYGVGYEQIALHNGHLLHNEGFRGENMLIAVIDGGWIGADTIDYFAPLYQEGRLLGVRQLYPWLQSVYQGGNHGTMVTSTMSSMKESEFVGTAPQASYYYIFSEEPYYEELIEEDFWAQAAVIADSIGADVVNSSLGYAQFPDFPQGEYTYAQLDGVSSIASRAATILGQKGVVVCIAAGNSGNDDWYYISHPADAKDILAVGAVNVDSVVATFSSNGPTPDGRIKPDVVSMGANAAVVNMDNSLSRASGTSIATPILAGLCACLWQALPEASSTQIMQYVRESGSCYNNPNHSVGYGLPDFYTAYTQHVPVPFYELKQPRVVVYPNPATEFINIVNGNLQIEQVALFTIDGRWVRSINQVQGCIIKQDVSDLPKGIYVGKVRMQNGQQANFKFTKM